MGTAIYPGSFDPLHNGHISIVRRGVRVFGAVIVSVARNIGKEPLFTLEERIAIVEQAFSDEDRVTVETFDGLLVDYARDTGATVILRGLRAVSDFEYELQMANMNRTLAEDVETLFMMTEEHQSYLSSRLIKEVASLGGDVSGNVPAHVDALLKKRFAPRDKGASSMIRLGDLVDRIAPSPTLAITTQAAKMRAEGRDVLSFSAGEPDFETPSHIVEAAVEALRAGKTKYGPAAGIAPLRVAVAERYRARGLDVDERNVVICCGAKHAIHQAMAVVLSKGDEVIIPAPYWVSYPDLAVIARAEPVVVQTPPDDGFRLTPNTLEAAITKRTRALVLNSPCNPTGTVYTRDELRRLGEVAMAHEVAIIYDAIYEDLVYGTAAYHELATLEPGLDAWTITVSGFSKSYAMTGWRVGYVVAPAEIARAIGVLQSQATSGISTFSQWAALEALTGSVEPMREMHRHFDLRRQRMVELVRDIPDLTCVEPQGAFYVFADVSAYLGRAGGPEDDVALCRYLLEQSGVALVPGSAFGVGGYVRLSYATSDDKIEEGLRRIREGLADLRR